MDGIGDHESIVNNLGQQNQSEQDSGDDSNHKLDTDDAVPREKDKDRIGEHASVDSLT